MSVNKKISWYIYLVLCCVVEWVKLKKLRDGGGIKLLTSIWIAKQVGRQSVTSFSLMFFVSSATDVVYPLLELS